MKIQEKLLYFFEFLLLTNLDIENLQLRLEKFCYQDISETAIGSKLSQLVADDKKITC